MPAADDQIYEATAVADSSESSGISRQLVLGMMLLLAIATISAIVAMMTWPPRLGLDFYSNRFM